MGIRKLKYMMLGICLFLLGVYAFSPTYRTDVNTLFTAAAQEPVSPAPAPLAPTPDAQAPAQAPDATGTTAPQPTTPAQDPAAGTTTIRVIFGIAFALFFLWVVVTARRNRQGPTDSRGRPQERQQQQQKPRGGGSQKDYFDQFSRSQTMWVEPGDPMAKSFADVAGCVEAINKLEMVKGWLVDAVWYDYFNARLPKGILLVGPPGTGKTLLAKALAGEAKASFCSVSGSQFVEIYVGVGASRVRDLFAEARRKVQQTKRPVIIFIDEIDAVARQRGGGPGASHEEREQTLNQILVEMDGFAPNQGILVLAATNRDDILDPAILRPGRFDYKIRVDSPDTAGREAILGIHTRGKRLAKGVILRMLAQRTPGYSGADLEAICNEAATLAANRCRKIAQEMVKQGKILLPLAPIVVDDAKALRKNGEPPAIDINKLLIESVPEAERAITLEEFDEAIDIVRMGEALKSRGLAMSKADLRQTAVHEAGHAAVNQARGGDPVTKITIVPRANALGFMEAIAETDRFNYTKRDLETRVIMAMGGRAAQEFFLQTVDTGASNDFQQAAGIVRRMITEFGMSSLGPICVKQSDPYAQVHNGPAMANMIDEEWKRLLNEYFGEAMKIIEQNQDAINRVVDVLLEKETILGPEFRALWDNVPPSGLPKSAETTEGDGASKGA